MREFHITDKAGNYIEDIDEAVNNSSEEIKNGYQFRKVKSFKYKITELNVIISREPKMKLRSHKYSSSPTILIIIQYMIMETSNNV